MSRASIELSGIREVVSLVWRLATPFIRRRLVVALVLLVAAAVLTGLGPAALARIVDGFSEKARPRETGPLLLISLYVISQFFSRAIGEIRGLVYARAERRLFRRLSEDLLEHVMRLPFRFHQNRQTGAIVQALDNGLQGYQLVLHHLVFTVLPVLAEFGTVMVVLLTFRHPAFLLIFCAAIICYAIAFSVFAVRIAEAADRASTAHVASTAAMMDAVLNCETVKFFGAERVVTQRLSRALTETEERWVGFYRRYANNGVCVAVIFATFLAGSVLLATYQVQNGTMSVGEFVLVNTYMLQVIRPVEMMGYAMQGFSQGVAMLQSMLALFREAPEPHLASAELTLAGCGEVEFERVTASYDHDRVVLRDVSFRIPAGRTLAIVGTSGSGKSTIVRLLTRLCEPDSGLIAIDGAPIASLSLTALRRSIAVVPQDTLLFNESIAYNIAFGKPASSREEIEHAARLAHLHEFILRLPDGYGTRVGERGVKLSGGERQRVSIARAALRRPKIYVFDEATSSLDTEAEREIMANLREISRSSTTIIIAHRLSTVVHADQLVVLDAGTIVERGTHAELLERGGKYAALWDAQHSGPKTVGKGVGS